MASKRDAVFLVPDLDMECAIKGLLGKPERLGIRKIDFDSNRDLIRDNYHDPSVVRSAPDLLKYNSNTHCYAIVLFDLHGCGYMKEKSADEIQQDLEARLRPDWEERARVIVIDPELEIWVWGPSPVVGRIIDWPSDRGDIKEWIMSQRVKNAPPFFRGDEYVSDENGKIRPPKEAFELVMRESRKRRSSRIYEQLASKAGLSKCDDPAFIRLRETLREWFPPNNS
ncbi:hypothetical protein J7K50_10025 [bacterium]|nr:hypothetical protein [bacterium]